MELSSNEELNEFATETGEKIAELESKNLDITTKLKMAVQQIKEMKALKMDGWDKTGQEERYHQIGKFLMAAKQGNTKAVIEMGGRITEASSDEGWKETDWDMSLKAAPDVGSSSLLRGDAVTGSYLVPEEFAREVLRIPTDPSALVPLVRQVTMGARKISFPFKADGVSLSWPADETAAKLEKAPTLGDAELEAKTAAGFIPYTDELNEDSLVGLAQYFSSLFQEAYEYERDYQLLAATTPFTGLLADTGTNIVNMGAGHSSFSSVTLDHLLDLTSALNTKAKRRGACFLLHITILDVIRKMRNDDGDYVLTPATAAMPAQLFGYPVIFSDAAPDLASSAPSTNFVAFGNPKTLILGSRVGLELKIFSETTDALVYNRIFLRARARFGTNVPLPAMWSVLRTAA